MMGMALIHTGMLSSGANMLQFRSGLYDKRACSPICPRAAIEAQVSELPMVVNARQPGLPSLVQSDFEAWRFVHDSVGFIALSWDTLIEKLRAIDAHVSFRIGT